MAKAGSQSRRDYQTVEGRFDETPGLQQEVALKALPSSRVTVRVVNEAGEAMSGAVVELVARHSRDVAEFSGADAKGIATFSDLPPGDRQFTARASGFTAATVRVAKDNRESIAIVLKRP